MRRRRRETSCDGETASNILLLDPGLFARCAGPCSQSQGGVVCIDADGKLNTPIDTEQVSFKLTIHAVLVKGVACATSRYRYCSLHREILDLRGVPEMILSFALIFKRIVGPPFIFFQVGWFFYQV